ncbi:conserved hypothetical protein [Candidatus Desulfarcum epimagneticum]|uniref:Transposase IS200-like domain-containing protein n=1 Tax=uncultured Desulfobacteraceae bacterium TaxID=218296 RepID=A0A484HM86_9BACT|nr:conserved hypothetical protein [uncultured Desulfobacteraceae bacterium]
MALAYHPEKHHRRSLRLKAYDYSKSGAYFVTICARNRECLFGDITDGRMAHSDSGRIASESWLWMGDQYGHVILDAWTIMPNHMHGIVFISGGRGGSRTAPVSSTAAPRCILPVNRRKPLGRLIGSFKTVSTKRINQMRDTPGEKIWQRNYYEHIIRNDKELTRVREYIDQNVLKWEWDRENPHSRAFS